MKKNKIKYTEKKCLKNKKTAEQNCTQSNNNNYSKKKKQHKKHENIIK